MTGSKGARSAQWLGGWWGIWEGEGEVLTSVGCKECGGVGVIWEIQPELKVEDKEEGFTVGITAAPKAHEILQSTDEGGARQRPIS